MAEIQAAEARYKALQDAAEETARIQLWEKLDKEIKLRRYDKLVFDMRKNFDEARTATNPFIGEQGYVIYPYGEVIPIITCRPMRMTDVAREPGVNYGYSCGRYCALDFHSVSINEKRTLCLLYCR